VRIEKAGRNKYTTSVELDLMLVLVVAYINVAIQVIIDDSTMICAAFDILDDFKLRPDSLFKVGQRL
jgi:hypothetical protein